MLPTKAMPDLKKWRALGGPAADQKDKFLLSEFLGDAETFSPKRTYMSLKLPVK